MVNWMLRIASSFSNRSLGFSFLVKAISRLVILVEVERIIKRTLVLESIILALRFMALKLVTLVSLNLEIIILDIIISC